MKLNVHGILLGLLAICAFPWAVLTALAQTDLPLYRRPEASVEARVEDLLRRMTLEEKLAQLVRATDTLQIGRLGCGSLFFYHNSLPPRESAEAYNRIQRYLVEKTRLGIPAFRTGEAIFAYMGPGSVCFPQPIAMAATFEPELVRQVAEALAEEVRPRGVRQVFAPVVNLARDVRWGRTGETYGEDPYLSARMGVAYVRAMEANGIVATPKHFVANMGLNGRFAEPVHFSEVMLRNKYFPAFRACIVEGGAQSIMLAYNTLNGIPCALHRWLITDVLKGEWGFDGYAISDGGGLALAYRSFGISPSKVEMAARAMNAGCDYSLDDPLRFYGEPLRRALEQGLASRERIDDAVRRILRVKFRCGLFDDPYADPDLAERIADSPEHRRLARLVAEKAIVLLKNENGTLPFSKQVKKVAVVGPLADWLLINHYGGWGQKRVTVLEGIRNLLPHAQVRYEKGAEMLTMGLPPVPEDAFIGGLRVEYFDNLSLQGKPVRVGSASHIARDWKVGAPEGLPVDHFSVRWRGKLRAPVSGEVTFGLTVDDGARFIIDGDTLIDQWHRGARRLATATCRLEKGRLYNVTVEYFEHTYDAVIQLGWDVDLLQEIPRAVALARESDVVVAVVGMQDDENLDRADLDLDEAQEALIKALARTGKPLAVVIQTGTVITMNDWIDSVPAVLMAWFPGEEGGNAIARVLFGEVNPGGKLPVTFPRVTGQVPLNYNHLPGKPDDRYAVVGNEPLFPFGHGLSYTRFAYSDLHLSADTIAVGDSVEVSLTVRNVGERAGDEVVQLYIHDRYASLSRPVKELKGFRRVSLQPGEGRRLRFTLRSEDLSFWKPGGKLVLEPGDFEVMVGSPSADIRLRTVLHVVDRSGSTGEFQGKSSQRGKGLKATQMGNEESAGRTVKLAGIQMTVRGGDLEGNLAHAAELVHRTALQGAELGLLPETFDLGWTDESARKLATAIPYGRTASFLRQLARREQVFLAAGMTERAGERIYNAALLISPRGEILLHHRKINELDFARKLYDLGNRLEVCQTELGCIGLLICADGNATGQVLTRALGYMDADLILFPSAWAVPPDYDPVKKPYGGLWERPSGR